MSICSYLSIFICHYQSTHFFSYLSLSDYPLFLTITLAISFCSYCDAKIYLFIPERDFIFARVKTRQVGTWSLVG